MQNNEQSLHNVVKPCKSFLLDHNAIAVSRLSFKPCIHFALLPLTTKACPHITRLSLNWLYYSTPILSEPLRTKEYIIFVCISIYVLSMIYVTAYSVHRHVSLYISISLGMSLNLGIDIVIAKYHVYIGKEICGYLPILLASPYFEACGCPHSSHQWLCWQLLPHKLAIPDLQTQTL